MLTEKNFNAIWYMIKGGAPDDEIMSSQGITEGTLNRIKKSEGDYAKYKKLHGEEVMKNNKRRNANNDDKRPATQSIVMENMESMKEAWK